MKHFTRNVQGWSIRVDIYANRTNIEGVITDALEIAFSPNMTIDQLKTRTDKELKKLPEAIRTNFRVYKGRAVTLQKADGSADVFFYLAVSYKERRVISFREPFINYPSC